ncbi:conserved hypothetical protein [Methanohalobium evestigatum Z-7303]|uniref:Uncharacterized protein n=1 Tax=Methanohalobium evestigatum (strain ATCC BAA-1072 / DSM 3721 / NBRC 107634 / OCM 161 / Z-7303) TaxID=644295 RepID=D7E6Z9_METEZ|nr:hypothetical protein [Methanohalobium evestigatum]ADI73623.1 conserved hypothetical protein [Methanohalobium evestigatum Z-7303]
MKKWVFILTIFFILASICLSGCSENKQVKPVNETILSFLDKVNKTDFKNAHSFYEGGKYPYPEVMKQIFRDEGFVKDGIANINLKDQTVNSDKAVITAHCRITEFNLNRNRINPSEKDFHFKLEKKNNRWIITNLSFNKPYYLSENKSENVAASVSDTDDEEPNYVLYILIIFSVIGVLVYTKNKGSDSSEVNDVDLSDTHPLQKETLAKFVKFVPSTQNKVGKKSKIDVWVKNPSKKPYNNFKVVAVYCNTLKVKNPTLDFGTIAPGQTVKQTWEVIPEASGIVSINKPTVVFENMGEKYSGRFEPVWIRVQ